MPYETFVGMRYFRGRKASVFVSVITLISIAGVAVGVWALTVVLSVMGGFEGDLKDKILGTYAHLLVEKDAGPFSGWEDALERLRATPGVAAAGAYVRSEIMVSSPTNLSGVALKGVDPAAAATVNGLAAALVEGSLEHLDRPEEIRRVGLLEHGPSSPNLDTELRLPPLAPPSAPAPTEEPPLPTEPGPADSLMPPIPPPARAEAVLPGVLIGRELKRNLLVTVGDVVQLVSPVGDLGPTGPLPKARPFRVAGVFYTGMYEYDTKIVYTSIVQAQRFLDRGDEVSGIEIKVPRRTVDDTETLAAVVRGDLGPGHRVRDWRALNSSLFAALKLERIAMFVILAFVVLVASFNIVSNLVLVVLEKAQEIAILKSLGASNVGVLLVFVVQGLVIGCIGTAVGLAAGLGTCWYISRFGIPLDPEVYYIDSLPVVLDPVEVGVTAVCAILIAFLATLYPAWQAARLAPVEGLRRA